MKKLFTALALTLCTVMLLSTVTVAGDSGIKTVLTLEEAKKMALENDVQFKLQDSYIQQKTEDYADLSENFSAGKGVRSSSSAGKAAGRINNQVNLENAYFAMKQEIFDKNDLKRASDYNVTKAYYDVMKAKHALGDAARDLELAKQDLDVAKIKVEHGLMTSSGLTQVENAYKTSLTEYNASVTDLQNDLSTLNKSIGGKMDISKLDVDMTMYMPNIAALDLKKIREDNLNNNPSFYTAKKSVDLAKYKKFLTDTEYDDNYDRMKNMNDDVRDEYTDMVFKANRDYDDAKYQYDEAVRDLDLALSTSYSSLLTMVESIENLRKTIETTKLTYTHNKTKYDLGLISKNDLAASEDALKDLESKLNTSIIDLNLQYLSLTQYSYTPVK